MGFFEKENRVCPCERCTANRTVAKSFKNFKGVESKEIRTTKKCSNGCCEGEVLWDAELECVSTPPSVVAKPDTDTIINMYMDSTYTDEFKYTALTVELEDFPAAGVFNPKGAEFYFKGKEFYPKYFYLQRKHLHLKDEDGMIHSIGRLSEDCKSEFVTEWMRAANILIALEKTDGE